MEVHESTELAVKDVSAWIATHTARGARIFDLRAAEEFARAQLPHAVIIDAAELLDTVAELLPHRDTPLLCYCARGITSLRVANALRGRGWIHAVSLAGGFAAWEAWGENLVERAADPLPKIPQNNRKNSAHEGTSGGKNSPCASTQSSDVVSLTTDDRTRYARQLALDGFGDRAQVRLKTARVAIVGVGGLGSPSAMYLAAAGVGHLTLIDPDRVERSNLHRQILFADADCGALKVTCAAARLRAQNPLITITTHAAALTADTARAVLREHDVVLDGTDDFAARYAINAACVELCIPLIHGSVAQFTGQVSVFAPARGGPCYACLYPPPENFVTTKNCDAPQMHKPQTFAAIATCADAGVLGVTPGLIGILQANETIKLLAQIGAPTIGRLLQLDLLTATTRELRITRDPACGVCGM